MNDEADLVGSRYTQTLSISNEAIENGINISNLHDIMVKAVKISKE